MNPPHPDLPPTYYGMFSGPESDIPLPGVLQLAGTDTRLTVWRSENMTPAFDFGKPVHGHLHSDLATISLWGLHENPPRQQQERVLGTMVEATTYAPVFGVRGAGAFDPDETSVSAFTLTSHHLRLRGGTGERLVSKEHGVLTVSTGTSSFPPHPMYDSTRIKLSFASPLCFADVAYYLTTLRFLCEAMTGMPHNFDNVFLDGADETGQPVGYRFYDFLDVTVPPRTLTGGSPHPVCHVDEFLKVAACWVKKFHKADSNLPEIFTHLSASLALAYGVYFQRLRVFQSVNVFDLFPKDPSVKYRRLEDILKERINLVAAVVDQYPSSCPDGFTAENLRKFAVWGADIRNRMVHGPLEPNGSSRPPHCADGQAESAVCDVLEAVLAMSTLLECGFKLGWVLHPRLAGYHRFSDMAHRLGNTVAYIEGLVSP